MNKDVPNVDHAVEPATLVDTLAHDNQHQQLIGPTLATSNIAHENSQLPQAPVANVGSGGSK